VSPISSLRRRPRDFPIIPCNLCGSQDNLQRVAIKNMLAAGSAKYPGRTETIFRAIGNVAPSQLADRDLFDFAALERDAGPVPDSLARIRAVNL
jgi:tRNA 2-thiocytidine biosynthesis protein TtcA